MALVEGQEENSPRGQAVDEEIGTIKFAGGGRSRKFKLARRLRNSLVHDVRLEQISNNRVDWRPPERVLVIEDSAGRERSATGTRR